MFIFYDCLKVDLHKKNKNTLDPSDHVYMVYEVYRDAWILHLVICLSVRLVDF